MGDTSGGLPERGGEETRVRLCGGEVIVAVDMVVKKKEEVDAPVLRCWFYCVVPLSLLRHSLGEYASMGAHVQ